MPRARDKETFGEQYGSSFQTKVIAGLLVDQQFVDRIWGILKPEYFDSKAHNWLFKKLLHHYTKYKTMPTVEDLDLYMKECSDNNERLAAFELLKEVQKVDVINLKLAKDRALEFCKNHNMRNALIHAIDLFDMGKYEEIRAIIDQGLFAGEDNDVGHDYFADEAIDRRYAPLRRTPIPTGLTHLDALLNGGLSRGELGVFIAGTGLGKTWLLCYAGFNALNVKKKVIHYTFELGEEYVGVRYDTMFTGIPINQLEAGKKEEVRRVLKQHEKNLIVKEYSPKRITVDDLRHHIEDRLLRHSFVPDLILVDYADLMRPTSKYAEKRFELESIYEELRGLAKEMQVPIWTASQGNRYSMMQNVVQLTTIAESWAKASVADVIVTLSRKIEDKLTNEGRLHLAKNRAGADGHIIPIEMDTEKFRIETKEPIRDSDQIQEYTKDTQSQFNDKMRQKKSNRDILKETYDKTKFSGGSSGDTAGTK